MIRPKKSQDIIAEQALDIGIPEEHLAIMVNSYYSELKGAMSNFKGMVLDMPNLGKLYIKENQLRDTIPARKVALEKTMLFKDNPKAVQTVQDDVDNMTRVWYDILEEREKKAVVRYVYRTIKKLRKNESTGKTTEDLG